MWHDLFALPVPATEKIVRTVVVYALVAVLIRAVGKRSLAGLNTLDVVVILLLSNVVQNAIIGADNSVTGGAIGAVVLVGADQLLNQAALRSRWFARVFDGTPTVVVDHGRRDERAIRRLGLQDEDLEHAIALQNGSSLADVETGKFMPGGQLLLRLRPEDQAATAGDVRRLAAQLDRIEATLAAPGGGVRDGRAEAD